MSAMQFDGTIGSAKAIADWIGDPAKVGIGPTYALEDGYPAEGPGGLDLIGTDANGAPEYKSASAGDYVVQSGDGYVLFGPEQYAAAFGN